jgi:hypothetical protein
MRSRSHTFSTVQDGKRGQTTPTTRATAGQKGRPATRTERSPRRIAAPRRWRRGRSPLSRSRAFSRSCKRSSRLSRMWRAPRTQRGDLAVRSFLCRGLRRHAQGVLQARRICAGLPRNARRHALLRLVDRKYMGPSLLCSQSSHKAKWSYVLTRFLFPFLLSPPRLLRAMEPP